MTVNKFFTTVAYSIIATVINTGLDALAYHLFFRNKPSPKS